MNRTFIAETRVAYGVYAVFPYRSGVAAQLTERLGGMQEYASAQATRLDSPAWREAAARLFGAVVDVQIAAAARRGRRRPLHRAAVTATLDAIKAFETLHGNALPHDAQGRYSPEPGTEYPFSVSDIGRAAARLLGDDWDAESTPWGVGAFLEHEGTPGGFTLGVDDEGDLYVNAELIDPSIIYLPDACASDGLDALAQLVADTVRSLNNVT
ncbi:hypothetical protein [Streptomyces boncukensis]|uniref:Uncharacterized protein n=1 Tax=Streptomyces boncukensis TaxID=2711219 RepID=A0A6G4WP16_9ACTN|nr:hypothetical protein [Streptomyces boncukensis]NGO67006.1 hypothetical protein [Streptomyces boncukensis]